MEKKISITIEEDIYDKFCLALNLSKEEEAQAVETCFKWYIAKTFDKISKEYEPEVLEKTRCKWQRKFLCESSETNSLMGKSSRAVLS